MELSGSGFSRIYQGSRPAVSNPPTTTPQFAAGVASNGGSSSLQVSSTATVRFPAQIYLNPSTQAATGVVVVLNRSTIGGNFAAGVPRYQLGDVILPPTTQDGGVLAADVGYWRTRPVSPGEQFPNIAGIPVAAGEVSSYYYSPHAEKTFATQPGRVVVTWVTRIPVPSGTDNETKYRFREESFAVSSASQYEARTIYWTERSFTGPAIIIPSGKIESVNPVYSGLFPSTVASEYKSVGVVNPTETSAKLPEEKRTLWFEKISGISQLRAYNLEGRIFIEYLGALRGAGVHEFLGADLVDVVRVAPPVTATVNLGEPITPRDSSGRLLPVDGGSEWLASTVATASIDSQAYYGNVVRRDGRTVYYAERENFYPDRVVFYWLEKADAALHFLGAPLKPELGIYWPKLKNNYLLIWPQTLDQFAHNTTGPSGSTAATGFQFFGGQVPQIVFQDDPAQSEARIDAGTQRLVAGVGSDGLNRTLLKFSASNEAWYVRLFTQADGRQGFLEGDGLAALVTAGAVGERLAAPAGYEVGGYVAAGRNYSESAYIDPFALGHLEAAKGAIIPVNALAGDDTLKVWWFKKVIPPSASFQTFYVPAKVGTYKVVYPTDPAVIVLASNEGSGDLGPSENAGSLYVQNDRAKIGFNPNEEHALQIAGRVYALRDDLNVTSGANGTSQPFVLLGYRSSADNRPAMRVFKVVREANNTLFNYPAIAGTVVQGPMPLPLLPLPLKSDGTVANMELPGTADTPAHTTAPPHYSAFTFPDRKGTHWTYRGPHGTSAPTFGMRFYYGFKEGFYVPGVSVQPAVGALLPYLRPIVNGQPEGDPVTGIALAITYRPSWPETAPELRVAETLTLPKFGLPAVRTQKSALVHYQQSVAAEGTTKPSVALHDPTREKTFALGSAGQLAVLPTSIVTSTYQGKTYFQKLPPHIQRRFFFDPIRGKNGALVLLGTFEDEVAGEDYLYLNVLSAEDRAALLALVASDDVNYAKWSAAIGGLATKVETFVENPLKARTYVPNSSPVSVDAATSAVITNSDTAVDSYALTATGSGSGWVSMVFGNGLAFTPTGDPVSMQIFRVAPRLNTGELKVHLSGNPLDEQVSVRHSGDFAAKPDDYEFDWRYAPPADGVAAKTYTFVMTSRLAMGWQAVNRPAAALPTAVEYSAARTTSLPAAVAIAPWIGSVTVTNGGGGYTTAPQVGFVGGGGSGATATATINSAGSLTAITLTNYGTGYTAAPLTTLTGGGGQNAAATVMTLTTSGGFTGGPTRPALVVRSTDGVDFTTGVPAKIIFSANLSDSNAGFVLYVNGVAALAANAPAPFVSTNASTGLVNEGLTSQFEVDGNFFQKKINAIEVALFTSSNPGASSNIDFKLHASAETDMVVAAGSPWQRPNGTLMNQIIVGGSPTSALGNPLIVLADNYFTMRYRPKIGKGNVLAAGNDQNAVVWSRWMPPKLIEGWIKRVLAGINPFNQRVGDLYNNATNNEVSLLTQAGKRWEGNISLTLENINAFGLIEIYETVLNRGRMLSIDAGYNYGPANDALLLVAGYLSDLYTLMGNEAFADAANPTIAVSSSDNDLYTGSAAISTSRFAFESQVKSVLEEELILLRGRDDSLAPGVIVAPAYNRLYWNYTRGINAGEALYAMNYNIREAAGSATADGKVDAADAQRMFPQGHGDAYGHYLTALKVYSRLLQSPKFTWTPRTEAVTVLGQAVQVDYVDERKFAAAAVNLARTAEQVLTLTYRQNYRDDAAAGWLHLQDGTTNPSTGITRYWGTDDWTSRASQGAFYNWVVGNSLLPDRDTDKNHSGIQVIDRTTVPELAQLSVLGAGFQTTIDSANARLNPLGLSPSAIAFDLSSAELSSGKSHYEQIQERALRAVLNAQGAFVQAARMTSSLRNQENTVADETLNIVKQETAYQNEMIEIYGTPYPGEVGPGKTYAQGYAGPDTLLWFIVDRPGPNVGATGNAGAVTVQIKVPTEVMTFSNPTLANITSFYSDKFIQRTFTLQPNAYVQYSDLWANGASLGLRSVTGALQQSLLDTEMASNELQGAAMALSQKHAIFSRNLELVRSMMKAHADSLETEKAGLAEIARLRTAQVTLETIAAGTAEAARQIFEVAKAASDAVPKVVGIAFDGLFGIRGTLQASGAVVSGAMSGTAVLTAGIARGMEALQDEKQGNMEYSIHQYGFDSEQAQMIFEHELRLRELTEGFYEISQKAMALQRAQAATRTIKASGERIQAEREVFRKRAAAVIQGYRTNDIGFRTFRNEALEQYRSLFDLAARYTYLAAKSYDYETGLLGSSEGQALINGVVASRALGDLSGGVPQATVSALGDAGLAGTMARVEADWSVAKPRLGINNPNGNGTLFSLRRELFRILPTTASDAAWQQTLEQHVMSNVLADPDVAASCRNLAKPDGSPVLGIVIPFSTTIEHGKNLFGLPSAPGDHNFSPSNFATKIYSVGMVWRGYIGMDPFTGDGVVDAGAPNSTAPTALNATPYAYLIPTGTDYMLAPPLGNTSSVRAFKVHDQAMPLPFNLGATAFSSTQFFNANGTLTEKPWILRTHQAFRPVSDPAFFYSSIPKEFTSVRLVGRSVWNSGWKIVIPAYALLSTEADALTRFVASVKDIELFLRTYSHSGN